MTVKDIKIETEQDRPKIMDQEYREEEICRSE